MSNGSLHGENGDLPTGFKIEPPQGHAFDPLGVLPEAVVEQYGAPPPRLKSLFFASKFGQDLRNLIA